MGVSLVYFDDDIEISRNRYQINLRRYYIENRDFISMTIREIRKNPFTGEWVIFSEVRQERPDRDKDFCPLCTGSEEVPTFTKPLRISNKYPALDSELEFKKYKHGDFWEKMTGHGNCELLVYTDKHQSKFIDMPIEEINQIFETWIQATKELAKDTSIKYVLPFENYGTDVGATLIHPHGQIYAFPFIPNHLKKEFDTIVEYKKKKNQCMVCNYVDQELAKDERIILQNQHLVVLIPYSAKYAYDIHIYPQRHVSYLHQCTRIEMVEMMDAILKLIRALNQLFAKEISYSLSLHQGPVNTKESMASHMYFKLHTPQRNIKSKKLLGAVETCGETFINGLLPETAVARLKNIIL